MKDGDIIVIESVEEASQDGKEYRLVTDRAGNEYKFKSGRGGSLESKWPILESNVGKAIKLKVEEFKGYPFIADFKVVADEFIAQATAKVQGQAKEERIESIEAQVAFKGMVELLLADKLDKVQADATIGWAMERISLPSVIIDKIEEAKGEVKKTQTAKTADTVKQTKADDSVVVDKDRPQTVPEFLTWLQEHSVKAPRSYLEKEWGIGRMEVLTLGKLRELYREIREKEGW